MSPPRRRMAPDDRRAEIVRAAGVVFAGSAYSAVSVADIAREAGVSAPLVIHHCGSKQALYLEVLRASEAEMREGLLGPPGPPSMERLTAILEWYAEFARTHRSGFLSLVRGEHEAALPEASAVFESLRADVTARTLADLREAGLDALADDPAAELAVRGYLGFVDSTIVRWLAQGATVDGSVIAALGAGAFTGCLQVLAERSP